MRLDCCPKSLLNPPLRLSDQFPLLATRLVAVDFTCWPLPLVLSFLLSLSLKHSSPSIELMLLKAGMEDTIMYVKQSLTGDTGTCVRSCLVLFRCYGNANNVRWWNIYGCLGDSCQGACCPWHQWSVRYSRATGGMYNQILHSMTDFISG